MSGGLEGFTIHSGGADGGDTQWDIIGRQYAVKAIHYREPGKTRVDSKVLRSLGVTATPISEEDYAEGIVKATAAAEFMGRSIHPTYGHYQYRNWAQVKYSDAVYAISRIVVAGETSFKGFKINQTQVDGGTGYAVQMATTEGKPVYVYCMTRNKWYYFDADSLQPSFRALQSAPVLTENFAGIGSRELTPEGIQAIHDAYKKTMVVEWGIYT